MSERIRSHKFEVKTSMSSVTVQSTRYVVEIKESQSVRDLQLCTCELRTAYPVSTSDFGLRYANTLLNRSLCTGQKLDNSSECSLLSEARQVA